ncbi:MAG TPA: hypothetical protein VLO11_11995 [Luteolibacter sp.]|nr:hypothetical protein [Luteolibacter sp.]
MTDKATLNKLYETAMRGNADFTGKPLKRAFPEPMLNTAKPVRRHFERPVSARAPQPLAVER